MKMSQIAGEQGAVNGVYGTSGKEKGQNYCNLVRKKIKCLTAEEIKTAGYLVKSETQF